MPLFYHMERFRAPHKLRMSHFYIVKNTRGDTALIVKGLIR